MPNDKLNETARLRYLIKAQGIGDKRQSEKCHSENYNELQDKDTKDKNVVFSQSTLMTPPDQRAGLVTVEFDESRPRRMN